MAWNPETDEVGIAVQSKIVCIGSLVTWARAGAGAIATQSYANVQYGPAGLSLLATGIDPETVINRLTQDDPLRALRQVGIVDAQGRVATFTGDNCLEWAGGKTGHNYCVQGNILTGPNVVDDLANAVEAAEGELALRLLSALDAGQAAGGVQRGRQSAALYIARDGWGYAGLNDRYRDLRVDDHPNPIRELRRIYELHKALFPIPETDATDGE